MIKRFPVKDSASSFDINDSFESVYGDFAYYYKQALSHSQAEANYLIPFFLWIDQQRETQGLPDYIDYLLSAFATTESLGKLDLLLMSRGADLKVSRFFYNNFAHAELQGTITDLNGMTGLWKTVLGMFDNSWSRIYTALFIDYSPIENYNMTEDENVGTEVVVSANQGVSTFGFNTADEEGVPTGKGESGSTTTGDYDKNKRKLKRHGNIGVTTNVTIITQELELRKRKFVDIIINDLLGVLTRPQF